MFVWRLLLVTAFIGAVVLAAEEVKKTEEKAADKPVVVEKVVEKTADIVQPADKSVATAAQKDAVVSPSAGTLAAPAAVAKAPAKVAQNRVAVIDAVEGEEEEEEAEEEEEEPHASALHAEHREAVDEEEEEEDQLALETSNVQEKDGAGHGHGHHHHEQGPAYHTGGGSQHYHGKQQGPIPVPLPVPVHPASVVLPTLPKQQYNPPAQYKAPPPSPYIPSASAPAPAYQSVPPPPPPPGPQAAYSAQRPVYSQAPPPPRPQYQPQPQPAYQPPPPPPAQPIYAPAPQPSYQPPPPPPPQPSYQPPPPPQAQPSYQQTAFQPPPPPPSYQPPAQAYQPPPPPPPAERNSYGPTSAPSLPEPAQQVQQYRPEATVALPAQAAPSEPWPAPVQDMPRIVSLDVKCEKNLMKVFIEFDKPFNGVIFSKGHYANANCVHLPAGLGRTSANFDVSINTCGTTGNTENGLYGYGSQAGSGTFFENTIIVQFDPQVQEVWDQARKLRCTWHDQYEKSVTFRPFPVDMLDVVRADFAGDNVGCWMQIQVGKGPWASEVSGLVKIGQTMTMVLAIKDDDGKFDMLVRNCMAHDGKRAPIQLVDQRGCVTRPKLMSRFTKIKNFGSSASVLSYAHFQAFKFPDSMEVHFQCTIQICRNQCPDQCAGSEQYSAASSVSASEPRNPYNRIGAVASRPRAEDQDGIQRSPRSQRDVSASEQEPTRAEQQDVGINRIIQVVSTGDLTFALEQQSDNTTTIVFPSRSETEGLICMTSPGFAATLVVLLLILIISCLLSAFLCIRHRAFGVDRSLVSAFANPAFAHKKGHF